MDQKSIMPVQCFAFLQSSFVNLNNNFAGPIMHLIVAGPSAIPTNWVAGDFSEASFTGYEATAVLPAASPIVNTPGQGGLSLAMNALFRCTTAPASPGVSILGYWIDDVDVGPIIAEYFPSPVPIINAGDWVNVQALLPAAYRVPAG